MFGILSKVSFQRKQKFLFPSIKIAEMMNQIFYNSQIFLKIQPLWSCERLFLSSADPVNQAFNNQRLSAHTDMPYYTQTPSVYFFHCVENELEGGESFWSDTFSAVQHIRYIVKL